MSQHYFETLHQGEMTEVLMGWDQPCQGFFLVISKQSDEEEPFYSNLYERNPHPQDLDYFLGVLKRFDITIPQTMINALREDKRSNAGNKHVSHFSDQHTGEKTC
jgi:hypothetical protein